MNVTAVLVVTGAVLFGCGVHLMLERSLTRVLIGIVVLSNGVNVLFLISSGPAGKSPFVGSARPERMSDPLPQALMLTAIVITLATTAFLLAMAYRSWQLQGHDDVQDDVEDAAIRRSAALDEASQSYDLASAGDENPGEDTHQDPVEVAGGREAP